VGTKIYKTSGYMGESGVLVSGWAWQLIIGYIGSFLLNLCMACGIVVALKYYKFKGVSDVHST
jgi:hypothetical protein